MKCPACGSDNVNVQLVQETNGSTTVTKSRGRSVTKSGHGCLWWCLIGWWWLIIDTLLWVFLFPFRFVVQLFKRKKSVTKSREKSVSQQKNKTSYHSMCICKDCGHHWEHKEKFPPILRPSR